LEAKLSEQIPGDTGHGRKPHICFVSESTATYSLLVGEASGVTGGAELQQTLIASALQNLGYRVTFLVPDFGQPNRVVTGQGIALIKTRPESAARPGPSRFLGDIVRLFRAMNQAGADIYYQRTSAAVTGITALFCKLKKKPFVFSVASNMDLDGSARLYRGRVSYALYRYGLKHATAVVVQTNDQLRLLKEATGRDGVLIRSMLATADEAREQVNPRYVLWVGGFWRLKRPEMFAELARRLPEYEFVMVGGPSVDGEQLFEEIVARARDLPNLRLTGPIPYKETARYLDETKVLVNTSHAEGFPNTYLQAWIRGMPVVATFDPDSLITKRQLGRYCSGIEELALATKELMGDESLRASIRERAIQYVRQHHSIESVAAMYDELLTGLYAKWRNMP